MGQATWVHIVKKREVNFEECGTEGVSYTEMLIKCKTDEATGITNIIYG